MVNSLMKYLIPAQIVINNISLYTKSVKAKIYRSKYSVRLLVLHIFWILRLLYLAEYIVYMYLLNPPYQTELVRCEWQNPIAKVSPFLLFFPL